jgi:hypothetical protein
MNTPSLRYAFKSSRPPRTARRLSWALGLTAAACVAACVAARAADMPPSAVMTQGMCAGLRAAGNADPHSPVVVTLEHSDGSTAFFRCDPWIDGPWHAVIERTVRLQQVPIDR